MDSTTINLTLSVEKANLVLQALAELPFRVSADLISEIREQAQGQLQEPQAADPTPVKTTASKTK